jgi:hypothetical protein
VDGRDPEDPEQPALGGALRGPAVLLHRPGGLRPPGCEELAPRLRVAGRVGEQDVGEQYRHALPLLGHGRGRREGSRVRRGSRSGIVPEDRPVDGLHVRPRLGSELLDEHAAGVRVRLEGIRLPAGPVEREDQLPAQSLAVGVLRDEGLQLGHELGVPARRQVGVDPVLEGGEAKVVQVRGRTPGGLAGEVGQRTAVPERERLAEERTARRQVAALRLPDEPPEAVEVELVRGDPQPVARRDRLEPVSEHAPQP